LRIAHVSITGKSPNAVARAALKAARRALPLYTRTDSSRARPWHGFRAAARLLAERTTLVASNRMSTSLRPVLILLPFHRLFLFHRLLFLALVLVFLATFVSHRAILSCCQLSFK
jgi:hypothetical protein